jgi:hypothetical protein
MVQSGPQSSCTSVQSISQTVEQVLFGMLSVQGGIISALFLGLFGILRSSRIALIASSVVLFAESVFFLVDGFFVLTILPAIYLAMMSSRVRRFS